MLAILLANLTFTSCDTTSNGVDTTSDTDCAITAVTLGTLLRTIHTTSTAGTDSTYNINVTGSDFAMYIDQLNNRIYNADSLPINTQVDKVVFSTLTGTSSLAIQSIYNGNDTLFVKTDSTDFRTPRTVKVWSADGTMSRDYTFEVNVHKEEADSFVWKLMAEGTGSLIADFVESRAVAKGETLYVFGKTADGSIRLATAPTATGTFDNTLTPTTSNGASIDVQSVLLCGGTFYALAGGNLVSSTDGQEWTAASSAQSFAALAGCSADSIYAATSGKEIMASADGENWTATTVDTEGSFLTGSYAATCCASHTDENISTIVYVGYADSNVEVWKHDIDKRGDYAFPWVYLPQTEELHGYGCPQLAQPSLVTYDESAVLVGLTADGKVSPLYRSWDYGRTWDAEEYYIPSITGATSISATVDTKQFLWIVCGGTGQVWRGRINRLAWNDEPTSYLKAARR